MLLPYRRTPFYTHDNSHVYQVEIGMPINPSMDDFYDFPSATFDEFSIRTTF